jgi:hypothetical protein
LSSARDETAAKAAHAIAMKMNRTLARMRPPEVLDPKGHQVRSGSAVAWLLVQCASTIDT